MKTELRNKTRLQPYVSVRFVGDTRVTVGAVSPQYLSESSFIVAGGVRVLPWHGAGAWFEAGCAMSYATGHMLPDYRGGVNYAHADRPLAHRRIAAAGSPIPPRTPSSSAGSATTSWCTTSRASATRWGRPRFARSSSGTAMSPSMTQRQSWANFVETGPGVRFRAAWMPPSMYVTTSLLRGVVPAERRRQPARPTSTISARESGMRLLVSAWTDRSRDRRAAVAWIASVATQLILIALLAAALASAAPLPYFCVLSADAGAWPEILSSIGLVRQPAEPGARFRGAHRHARFERMERAGGPGRHSDPRRRIVAGRDVRLPAREGVRQGRQPHRRAPPGLAIVWEKGLELPVFELPGGATVFARERWTGAPMMAGMRRGAGILLWVAVPPGERGYERFPYLLQALADLGMEPPFSSARLWAFFDSAYRSRVDLDYFAARWRTSGIAALHVAAWHFYEPDPEQDAYLEKLIAACHREGILVYAWLELPHVSEKFWADHPEWREKTAVLQDAQLDWRKLMNLTNRDCFRAAADGTAALVKRFDWDGVNLAELYFESLEGIGNPSRFTPMNDDVRARVPRARRLRSDRAVRRAEPRRGVAKAVPGFSRRVWPAHAGGMAGRDGSLRREKPHLDLVLTHVDDRFDTGMRDAIGADAARVLPLLDTHSFTFLIEDPATVWNLGPQRYQAIAERYRPITSHRDKLAIDLNIVDRYQNVYPTKQQTGTELFELVHNAARNFERVALYFENSLLAPDLRLLPSAAAAVGRVERIGPKLVVESVSRRGRSLARPGPGGWPALAGAGCGNRLAAGRCAQHRGGAGRFRPAPAAAQRRAESRPQRRRALHRVHLSKRRSRHRCARSHAADGGDRFDPRHAEECWSRTPCCYPAASIS